MEVPDPIARLGRQVPARWSLTLCADAGEAGGSFRPVQLRSGGFRGVKGAAKDPERAAQEAGRRARAKVRQYCVANGLNHMVTLTYGEGLYDEREFRLHMADFFRQLRTNLGGKPFPYVWVPEWHPGGHGLHAHCAVGRRVKHGLIKETWGRGHVWITQPPDMPVGSTKRDEARRAAGYLSKYVTKGFDAASGGLHRYEVAQGFRPTFTRLEGRRLDDVLGQACQIMREEPSIRWSSLDVADWQGPPAVWFSWA